MLLSSDIRTSKVSCPVLLFLLLTAFHLIYFASSVVLPDRHPLWQPSRSIPSPPVAVASFPQRPPPPPPFQVAPVPVSYRVKISVRDVSSLESSTAASSERSHSSSERPSMMLRCPNSTKLLSAEQVCDGVDHCPGGSDESRLACELHLRGRRSQSEAAEQVNGLFYLSVAVSVLFYLLFLSILLVHCIGVWQAMKKQTSIELSSIRPSKGCLKKKKKESFLQSSATVPWSSILSDVQRDESSTDSSQQSVVVFLQHCY